MKVQFDVFGSLVSRDVMRYMQPDTYVLNRCIGGVPISNLFDASLHIDENKLERANISQYDKRMMMIQLNRNAPSLLKKSNSSVLIMDLASECMNRIVFQNDNNTSVAYPDTMEKYIHTFFGDTAVPFRKTTPFDIDMKVAEKNYRRFAKSIVRSDMNPGGYLEENIIIIEAYYTEKYIRNRDAAVHTYDSRYQIKEKNEMLKRFYTILYNNIPNCRIIKLPDLTYSTENHIRGLSPLCYTDETYKYISNCIEVLCGISKKNSIDNLYNEACLQNTLTSRLMGLRYYFSNIKIMKNEIQELNVQIEELQRQLSELKKSN